MLQEILHRYSALKLWKSGRRLYDHTRVVPPRVVPITGEVTDLARSLMGDVTHLMARDALHTAVVITTGATAFCSYDRDFDRIPGLRRVELLRSFAPSFLRSFVPSFLPTRSALRASS